jgi:hypothetical protein
MPIKVKSLRNQDGPVPVRVKRPAWQQFLQY